VVAEDVGLKGVEAARRQAEARVAEVWAEHFFLPAAALEELDDALAAGRGATRARLPQAARRSAHLGGEWGECPKVLAGRVPLGLVLSEPVNLRRVSMANMTPRAKQSRIRRLIERDGLTCQICFEPMVGGDFTLDHIVPRGEGGGNGIHNLRLAHYRCNHGRHNILR
jgi:5-methylcytosine-specific restriction endonuclease McrA